MSYKKKWDCVHYIPKEYVNNNPDLESDDCVRDCLLGISIVDGKKYYKYINLDKWYIDNILGGKEKIPSWCYGR